MGDVRRFDIRLHPNALKEYNNLDNTTAEIVDKAFEELEIRADEVGKRLQNMKSSKLAGCKEIKLRDSGLRIIFQITNEVVHVLRVVQVIAINERDKDKVFKIAHNRLAEIKKLPPEKKREHYQRLKKLMERE